MSNVLRNRMQVMHVSVGARRATYILNAKSILINENLLFFSCLARLVCSTLANTQ